MVRGRLTKAGHLSPPLAFPCASIGRMNTIRFFVLHPGSGLRGWMSPPIARFPQYFMVHLVDLLYYAGRLPLSSETGTPPRDQHLIAYAEDLRSGEPKLWRSLGFEKLRPQGEVQSPRQFNPQVTGLWPVLQRCCLIGP